MFSVAGLRALRWRQIGEVQRQISPGLRLTHCFARNHLVHLRRDTVALAECGELPDDVCATLRGERRNIVL
jgi:hypothetical protein